MMMTLSLREPLVLMLTVISWGLAENNSLVSHFFCPRVTDFSILSSMPWNYKFIFLTNSFKPYIQNFYCYEKRDNPLQHNWKQLTNQSIFVERGKKSMYLNVKNISNDCLEFEIRMVPPLGSVLLYPAFRFPLLVAMFDNNFKHISRTQSGKSSHSWEDKLNLQPCKNMQGISS